MYPARDRFHCEGETEKVRAFLVVVNGRRQRLDFQRDSGKSISTERSRSALVGDFPGPNSAPNTPTSALVQHWQFQDENPPNFDRDNVSGTS